MTNLSSGNGFESGSAPTILVNPAVEDHIAVRAPAAGRSRNRRVRATMPQQTPTVSLVIPVRNEARNIAWVLEQIADDVHEIILVDGDSSDATLITARRYRPDIKVVPQDGAGKGCAQRRPAPQGPSRLAGIAATRSAFAAGVLISAARSGRDTR